MNRKTASQRLKAIVDKFDIRDQFPSAVLEESERFVSEPGLDDGTKSYDHLPFVTIDNDDSRDLDQALYITDDDDGFTVYYALADASYYVTNNSELFGEALARGASFYFPTFAHPMLPESLSEGIVSLNPNVRRRALMFVIKLDKEGGVVSTNVERATIRSYAKLSYNGVQVFFDEGAQETSEWSQSLRALRTVGDVLIASADRRGIIQFDRHEASIGVTEDDTRFVLNTRARNDVEKWNEQISLLINTEGAKLLAAHAKKSPELQSIYRVHLPPLSERLSSLQEIVDDVCDRYGLDDTWRWKKGQPLSAYLKGLPRGGEHERVRQALQRQVRYTNRASEFTPYKGQHFALAVDQYARFSSPMREVVGIFTHKEALEALGITSTHTTEDAALRERVIAAANDSKSLQKKIDKEVALCAIQDLLETDMTLDPTDRHRRSGTIIGIRATRLYILLDEIPMELKINVDDLEAQFATSYELQGTTLLADDGPSFGIGDGVVLTTDRWDIQTRRFKFRVEKR